MASLRSVPRSISYIVVHHCAAYDVKRRRVVHQTFDEIRNYHMLPKAKRGRGFNDIAYHRFVEQDGKIVPGRSDSKVGAHVEGWNTHTLAICGSGHGDFEPFTPAQRASIYMQCAAWCIEHQLPPSRVIGHREADDFGAPKVWKTCPGMLNDMDQIRREVAVILRAA